MPGILYDLFMTVFQNPFKVLVGMLCNYTHMITSSHVFAIHMAIADLLLILLLPLHIIEHRDHGDWLAGTALCSISNTCQVMNFIVSIFLLTLMAADRYIGLWLNYLFKTLSCKLLNNYYFSNCRKISTCVV